MSELCGGCLWAYGGRCTVYKDVDYWYQKGFCPAKVTEKWEKVKIEEEIKKYSRSHPAV